MLLLIIGMPVHSQTKTDRAHVKWGPDLTFKKDGDFNDVVGYTDDHVYMTMQVKKEVFLQKMDLNNKKVYQKLLPMKVNKDDHSLQRIDVFGDRILVFSTFYDKKEKTNDLYLRIFNEQDMSPQGGLQRLATIDVDSKRSKGGFSVQVSPNEQVILISQLLPYAKEEKERFNFKVYDNEMNAIWDQNVDLPYLDSEFAVNSIRVANDNSVIMLGKKFAEKSEARALKKEGQDVFEYHLITYDGDGGSPNDEALHVPDKFLQDLTLDLGDEGDILAGGFYGLKGANAIHGVFFMRLDRDTKAILHSNFKEFDKDFITQYMTEKEEKKVSKKAEKKGEEVEMVNYDLRDIIRRTDGGAVLVGEQYSFYVTTHSSTDAQGRTTTYTVYHYVYNDIIVVNVDPDGNIEWAAKVPKRQHTKNDGGKYSSYAMAVKEDMIYLIFNDSGKNLFLTPGQKVESFRLVGKEALITLATIDGNGTVHREALLAPDRRDAIARPKACMQLADDRMFMYASRKKDYRFGSMVFE